MFQAGTMSNWKSTRIWKRLSLSPRTAVTGGCPDGVGSRDRTRAPLVLHSFVKTSSPSRLLLPAPETRGRYVVQERWWRLPPPHWGEMSTPVTPRHPSP